MPVIAVRDLRTHLVTRWGTVRAVDGVAFDGRRGRDAGAGGRVGLGQEHDVPEPPAPGAAPGRAHPLAAGILEGEMKRMAGDVAGSIEPFTRASDLEAGMAYDEPEPLPFSPRHWLGAALLELKRFDDAERAYRADLKEHPKNGWSLLGLKQALAGRGADTSAVDQELAAAWARADTWIRSSRF